MIPVSFKVKDALFCFCSIGEGMLELLFEDQRCFLIEWGVVYLGAGARKFRLPIDQQLDGKGFADGWIHYRISYEAAASLIEWASQEKARGNWEAAPNKSKAILELYGKVIITPQRLAQEWEATKR